VIFNESVVKINLAMEHMNTLWLRERERCQTLSQDLDLGECLGEELKQGLVKQHGKGK